jgi:hypothetical protein
MRCARRSWPDAEPPGNGWADGVSEGRGGGSLSMGVDSSGATRAETIDSSVEGIVKGEDCGGIDVGCGGRD